MNKILLFVSFLMLGNLALSASIGDGAAKEEDEVANAGDDGANGDDVLFPDDDEDESEDADVGAEPEPAVKSEFFPIPPMKEWESEPPKGLISSLVFGLQQAINGLTGSGNTQFKPSSGTRKSVPNTEPQSTNSEITARTLVRYENPKKN